jgi:hypothetical protein
MFKEVIYLVIESPVRSGYLAPGPPNRLDVTPEPQITGPDRN